MVAAAPGRGIITAMQPSSTAFSVTRLGPDDVATMHELLTVFGEAFGDVETYGARRPSDAYLRDLLASSGFVALAACRDGQVIGGLAAYELRKFEQARSEFYLYDLAVAEAHRRQGLARELIARLQGIAAERGAYVVFVQADVGDDAAIALYDSLGLREEVLHFDIAVPKR